MNTWVHVTNAIWWGFIGAVFCWFIGWQPSFLLDFIAFGSGAFIGSVIAERWKD